MSTLYNHRPHAFRLTGHDTPVLSPFRVSLELVPFDQSPSLHPLRDGWLSRLVRRLRGYYDSVRLPMFVHRQITSLDLLTRSARHWRINIGSPGSRARCLRTCTGSLTARDSGAPRDIGAPDGAFRFLLIVTLGKVSVREISTVVVARACLWKCEKFEFADRLHWRRQASRGHEYVPLTLDVY